MEMTTVKTWGSKTGALMFIDDQYGEPAFEDAEAVRVDRVANYNGWTVAEVWAVQLPDGRYVGQEEG